MKDRFAEYYLPDFAKLWRDAIFVFDTNVILGLYKSSASASKEFLNLLNELKSMRGEDSIWMPHQFAHEYHMNLAKVIFRANEAYKNDLDQLLGIADKTANILKDFETRTEYKIPKIKSIKFQIS